MSGDRVAPKRNERMLWLALPSGALVAWAFIAGFVSAEPPTDRIDLARLPFSSFGLVIGTFGAAAAWTTTLALRFTAPTLTRGRFLIEVALLAVAAFFVGRSFDLPVLHPAFLIAIPLVMVALSLSFYVVAWAVEIVARERAPR